MIRVAVIIAEGSEEIELITPIDVLRRSGAHVDIVSTDEYLVEGSHGIVVKADTVVEAVDWGDYDAYVIPGGMPGATNIYRNNYVKNLLTMAHKRGKLIASICASPAVVLAGYGLVKGKKVTCYPAPEFVDMLTDATYTGADVEVDGKLITANGPKSALDFSVAIAKALGLEPKI
ncbi:MAG: DJ-1/PfpI family protein [Clostridia bacterium]|nr:DJ-1/PfpI family protein [Clostridia bacterium]MBR7160202.1 DJ-1/PfpI family protein [Clostridia bacterium]